eukprot:6140308-Pyramimonas_sp.AAC.1
MAPTPARTAAVFAIANHMAAGDAPARDAPCATNALRHCWATGHARTPCLLYTSDAADDTPCVDL